MTLTTITQLEDVLLRLSLVSADRLNECHSRISANDLSIRALLDELSRSHLLTSYQLSKLEQGELDGLRLGPYKLLYRNASGSFARVFRGCRVTDNTIIGLKVLRDRWASDQRMVSLFKREGEIGKRLQHPNIVPIYDVASEGKQHYFTMEFIDGGNFRDLIKARKRFPPESALRFIMDMTLGLEYALGMGFTHRDLKMTNVLLSTKGVAKLVDFGLAGQERSLVSNEEEVDRAVEYVTLERGSNSPENDPRSDLYFLGAIAYELLSGVPPYPSTKEKSERKKFSRYTDYRPLDRVAEDLDPNIVRFVMKLMKVSPYERYQTPTEALADLRPLVQQYPLDSSGSQPIIRQETLAPVVPVISERTTVPTILCVESRLKHQDALRDYFSKHRYRVLLLASEDRALIRMETTPPDVLVLMGDSLLEALPAVYEKATRLAERAGTSVIVVLSKRSSKYRPILRPASHTRILPDPVTLRDVRKAIEEMSLRD